MLASVLAADRRRTVLLVEPAPGDLEEATRQARAGVGLGGPEDVTDQSRFVSGVVIAGSDDLGPLLPRLLLGALSEAVIAIVTDARHADSVAAVLLASGRPATAIPQHLRLASTLGTDHPSTMADELSLLGRDHDPTAVVVLAGIEARPSVFLGRDAGPARQWAEADWVRQSMRRVDAELRADDAVRIDELTSDLAESERQRQELDQQHRELAQHAAGLQGRIRDLEASTSWRLTVPLRWISDRVKRR